MCQEFPSALDAAMSVSAAICHILRGKSGYGELMHVSWLVFGAGSMRLLDERAAFDDGEM